MYFWPSLSLFLLFLPQFFSVSLPVQHVPTLLVMKPISVTEIVSMATEVLIITDTPTARAGEEHTHTHTRAHTYACTHTYPQTPCMERSLQWITTIYQGLNNMVKNICIRACFQLLLGGREADGEQCRVRV